ncbi:MAG TPA: HAD-IA family hydrolase [Xanthobacteraceae bacterium]|jgi:HAD superfamily hydrolase (TIGR01509 family)
MKLEALLFDVDGTLVDTEELHRQAFNQAFLEFDLGWDWDPGLYIDLLAVSGGVHRIAHYIDTLGLPPAEKVRLRGQIPAIHRAKTRNYGELLGSTAARLRPGIARLIKEARQAGLAVGLASTSSSMNLDKLLATVFGDEERTLIDVWVSADQVARKKPAPDIYELLLSMLRVPATACVAFEDSANGLAAAKAAGLFTVVTPSRWTKAQKFNDADLVIPSIGDPDQPLDPAHAMVAGAPYLALARLRALRSVASLVMTAREAES